MSGAKRYRRISGSGAIARTTMSGLAALAAGAHGPGGRGGYAPLTPYSEVPPSRNLSICPDPDARLTPGAARTITYRTCPRPPASPESAARARLGTQRAAAGSCGRSQPLSRARFARAG